MIIKYFQEDDLNKHTRRSISTLIQDLLDKHTQIEKRLSEKKDIFDEYVKSDKKHNRKSCKI